MSITEMSKQTENLLDDCVAMMECQKVLRERGALCIDELGVELREDVFDRCFPGIEWEERLTKSGESLGIWRKFAQYRGVSFETMKIEE